MKGLNRIVAVLSIVTMLVAIPVIGVATATLTTPTADAKVNPTPMFCAKVAGIAAENAFDTCMGACGGTFECETPCGVRREKVRGETYEGCMHGGT